MRTSSRIQSSIKNVWVKHLNAIQNVLKIVAITGVASQKTDVKNRTTRESSKDIKDMSKKGDKS